MSRQAKNVVTDDVREAPASASPGLQTALGNRNIARMLGAAPIQRVPPNASTPSTAGGPAGADPVERVKAAINARNLDGLITIEKELRFELAKDPLNPPLAVREALANARHWAMERIAAIRDTYAAPLAQNATVAGSDDDHSGEREVTETLMDDECAPFLGVLAEGHPEYRYEYANTDVQTKVLAAVSLHASRRGVAQIGHRSAAEAESRAKSNLTEGSWCGAFAYTQAEAAGGLGPHLRAAMQGEGGIRSALTYAGAANNPWVWVFNRWTKLQDYHAERKSLRFYDPVTTAAPAHGILPGDLVLIDNSFGTDPDHITTAVSFDGRFLRTIGGNQGGAAATDETGVSRGGPFDLLHNPIQNDVTLPKDKWPIGKDGKPVKTADPTKVKNHRVHGVGRWSIVDYEIRLYHGGEAAPAKPTANDLKAAASV